jgi:DNA-binding beta-propeller fold protein YncE
MNRALVVGAHLGAGLFTLGAFRGDCAAQAQLSKPGNPARIPSQLLEKTPAKAITIDQPALYPETIEVNPLTKRFLVSSVREGAVYGVGLDGKAKKFIQDDRLTSILGIAVDARSNRLLVTNSDLGGGIRPSARGPKKEAGVGIYDLKSGGAIHYVDLLALRPEGDHLINGIAVDAQGNAYVTDSFSPVIYKVDSKGVASIFLQSEEFKGPGINLNGVVYHPDGFLLVVKKSTGALYRVPIADPQRFSRVNVATPFVGGDGLLLVGGDRLVVIANKTPTLASESAFVVASADSWRNAEVVESKKLGSVYPTTCAVLDGKLYGLSSHLDEWIGATAASREAIMKQGRRGEIQQIGTLGPRP